MGKSPFAKQDTHTYHYPEPLDHERREGENDVQYKTRQDMIDPEELEQGHWVKIKVPRSRGLVDQIADRTQSVMLMDGGNAGPTFEQRIARGNREAFELLCEGWSFDAEVNAANYERLDTWSGDWIAACLADAIRRGTDRGWVKKTSDSSNGHASSEPSSNVPPAVESGS